MKKHFFPYLFPTKINLKQGKIDNGNSFCEWEEIDNETYSDNEDDEGDDI